MTDPYAPNWSGQPTAQPPAPQQSRHAYQPGAGSHPSGPLPAQPYPAPPVPQYAPQPQYGYPAPVVIAQTPGNGLGTAGFVTGLLGLIFCWVPVFGLILGVLGIVLGGAGMSYARKNRASSGLAIAGLVLGIISLVPAIIVIAALSSA